MKTFIECGSITLKGEMPPCVIEEYENLIMRQVSSVVRVNRAQRKAVNTAIAERIAVKPVKVRATKFAPVRQEAIAFKLFGSDLYSVKDELFNITGGLNVFIPNGYVYWGNRGDSFKTIAQDVISWLALGYKHGNVNSWRCC